MKCANIIEHEAPELSITIYIPSEVKQIDFDSLFVAKTCTWDCKMCSHNQHLQEERFEMGSNTRFILLVVSSSGVSSTAIKKFDANIVEIPCLDGFKFRVKSAVVYYASDSKNYSEYDHYVIWVRSVCNSGWIRISDNHGRFYTNLISDLKDVKLLILEKL